MTNREKLNKMSNEEFAEYLDWEMLKDKVGRENGCFITNKVIVKWLEEVSNDK